MVKGIRSEPVFPAMERLSVSDRETNLRKVGCQNHDNIMLLDAPLRKACGYFLDQGNNLAKAVCPACRTINVSCLLLVPILCNAHAHKLWQGDKRDVSIWKGTAEDEIHRVCHALKIVSGDNPSG